MRKEQVLLAALLIGAAFVLQGCLAVVIGAGAAGAGTVAYIRGDLEVTESAKLDDVYRATEKAVTKLELNVTSKTKDALSATVIARDAQDKKITIRLKATAEGSTTISIRIGLFGDEAKSRIIYDKIRKNL